jgi:hypothetical protein
MNIIAVADHINCIFEAGCVFPVILDCLKLFKKKSINETNLWSQSYYFAYSFWATFYMWELDQHWSFIATLTWAILYIIKTCMVFYYKRYGRQVILEDRDTAHGRV